jgi:hypothetical protein
MGYYLFSVVTCVNKDICLRNCYTYKGILKKLAEVKKYDLNVRSSNIDCKQQEVAIAEVLSLSFRSSFNSH